MALWEVVPSKRSTSANGQFDILITMDASLPKQQNLAKLRLAVIGLKARSNRLADTPPLMPKVLAVLPTVRPGKIVVVA